MIFALDTILFRQYSKAKHFENIDELKFANWKLTGQESVPAPPPKFIAVRFHQFVTKVFMQALTDMIKSHFEPNLTSASRNTTTIIIFDKRVTFPLPA